MADIVVLQASTVQPQGFAVISRIPLICFHVMVLSDGTEVGVSCHALIGSLYISNVCFNVIMWAAQIFTVTGHK